MKTLARIEKSKSYWFLLIVVFIFFLLRLPSLIEPYWYGDEGIYHVIGDALNNGKLLYRDIWDNKPPLLYIIYALFKSDQFSVRTFSLIAGIGAVIAFFAIVKTIFQKSNIQFSLTTLFAFLFGLPLLEGNIANSENFMLFFILVSGYLILKSYSLLPHFSPRKKSFVLSFKSKAFQLLLMSGFILSFAFLFKAVAMFDFLAFSWILLIFILLHTEIPSHLKQGKNLLLLSLSTLFPFVLGFSLPIVFTTSYFLMQGAFLEFLKASLFQNVGYVGYGNTLIIPHGLLIIKCVLLFIISIGIYLKRERFTKGGIFIIIWSAFSLFNAFFSQRPYTHYLLVFLPSFILLCGLFFQPALSSLSKKDLQKNQIIFLVTFFIILFALVTQFRVYSKTLRYYQNFLTFITNKKTVQEYQAFFDKKTPRDYEIAQYIKMRTKESDSIFVWGNNAQLYTLANKLPPGRFIVAYHITAYPYSIDETREALTIKKPRFIIVMPDSGFPPYNLLGYSQKLIINQVSIYERVY